ncbi:hypothetical protein D3C86_1923110 [compost metagenome]
MAHQPGHLFNARFIRQQRRCPFTQGIGAQAKQRLPLAQAGRPALLQLRSQIMKGMIQHRKGDLPVRPAHRREAGGCVALPA